MSKNPPNMLTFEVKYELIDGAHFFVADKDERLKGFCVANKNYSKALDGAFMAIRTMYKENHGVDLSSSGIAISITNSKLRKGDDKTREKDKI